MKLALNLERAVNNMAEKILEVKDLKQHFGTIKAVDGISFDVYKGETLGLVGESGSGKSTTGRSIIRLYDITGGEIKFNGRNVQDKMSSKELRSFNKEMQMIFQDPYASLNPRMTAGEIISEGFEIHGMYKNKKERRERVGMLLEAVGLNREHANRYAHEFSGGQRQRIGIARALSLEPSFIIADEPISALDVSIQAQVVNLLKQLQKERDLTYLFIAHDLSMVKYISDRIAVMHRGKLVEIGTSEDIYNYPVHPYTKSLLSAIPLPDPLSEATRKRIPYKDEEPEGELSVHEVFEGHFVYATDEQIGRWYTGKKVKLQ